MFQLPAFFRSAFGRQPTDHLSRFDMDQPGTWLPAERAVAEGPVAGRYRAAGARASTDLVVVRSGAPASPPQPSSTTAAKAPATKAVHLAGGPAGVLLFHGLSSTPLELLFLARGLHRAGYTVRIAVIPGYSHGLPSAGTDHRHWVDGALEEFDRMRAQCDTLAVGGLCIGALLSLVVAARRSDQVSHVLALSTTLHYDGWAAPWTRWMLPLARVLPWAGRIAVKEREPYGLKDERLRAWIAAQMRESGGSDAGAAQFRVRDLVQAQNLMRVVRQGLKLVQAPTLVIHALEDECASTRSAFEVSRSVSSRRLHCVILKDSYHMISIDKEKARVLSELKDFLEDPSDGPAAPPEPAGRAVIVDGQVQPALVPV